MLKLPKAFTITYLFFFIGLATSCKVQEKVATTNSEASLVLKGPAWAAAWQQQAGEYKALCSQAYNLAQMRLDILLQQPYTKPVAIVTDIDETVLDNSPYQVHQALRNAEYSDSSWVEWTARVDCDTIPGALSFLRYAKSKGVAVFYITNRLEKERTPTLKDLQRWGFPDAADDHLTMKTTTSGKEPRRNKVADKYEIVLLLGDNLSDFSAVFDKKPQEERNGLTENNSSMFGKKFIVLPNAMYGDWDGALYNYKYELPAKQKAITIIKGLKQY